MSLKIWLPLNGDLENKGCSDVTIVNNGAIVDDNGKIGKCYYFNGSSWIRITMPTEMTSIKNTSVCAWIKSTGSVVALGGISNDSNYTKAMVTLYTSGWQFGSSNAYKYISGGTIANTNIWHHVCCTIDDTTITTYLDGTKVTNKTLSELGVTSIEITSSNFIEIGCDHPGGDEYLTGYINDFRIYNHCLSAAEIKEISQGLVLHYKLDGFNGGAGENLVINGDARNGLTNWGNWETATERRVVIINNKNWFTFKTDPTGKVGGISQDRGLPIFKPNTYYTASALMYASANVSGRLWVHTRSTEGGNNLAQYLTTVSVTTTPAVYTFTFNTGTNASYTINKIHLMVGAVSATSTLDFYVSDIKLEEGKQATIWTPCKEESGYDYTKIQDSSGYEHHGVLVNGTYIADSPRYNNNIQLLGTTVDSTSNTIIGAQYFYGHLPLPASTAFTVSWWCKNIKYARGGIFETTGITANDLVTNAPADHYATAIANYDSNFFVYNGTSNINFFSSFSKNDNIWHHNAIVFDGSTAKYYKDGTLIQTGNLTGTLPAITGLRVGIGRAGGVYRQIQQEVSDLRIYVTALLNTDIKQLYNTNLKIDDKHNIHTFTIKESNLNSNQITKTGNLKSINFNENGYLDFLHYDKEIYTEPDGSKWVHVFHHNNPAAIKFDNPNQDWLHGKYINDDAWYDLEPIVSNLVNYEFLYRQKATDTGSIATYRWTQPIDPIIATWVDVSPSSGNAVYNTSNGYYTSNMGGMYLMKSSQLHMCIANASNGNWFGGIGVSTAYQNGIPGYPNTVVTTGCIDLYVRIYLPTKLIKDKGISTLQYIEK